MARMPRRTKRNDDSNSIESPEVIESSEVQNEFVSESDNEIISSEGSEMTDTNVENTEDVTTPESDGNEGTSMTDVLNEAEGSTDSEGSPEPSDETPPVEKTFNEKLAEFLTQLNEDVASGEKPLAVSFLAMWSGLESHFKSLEEIHKTLTYTGPSENEMRTKRAASEDEEIRNWNAEIEKLEKQIREKKLLANRKLMGADFVEPLSDSDKETEKQKFAELRGKVQSTIGGFTTLSDLNGDYGKEFTAFLSSSIPDLRSKATAEKKPVSTGAGTGQGRKPFFTELELNGVSYDRLPKFRSALESAFKYSGDAYVLRKLAEEHGASPSNPVVEFEVHRKSDNSPVPVKVGVNFEAKWDEDRLKSQG